MTFSHDDDRGPCSVTQRWLARLLTAGLVASLAGCGGIPRAPTLPTAADLRGASAEPLPGLEDDPPTPMALFPGDVLTITSVSDVTTVLENVVVDGAGHVHLPLVGDVDVGQQDISEAEARLEEATQRYDRFARVSVHVSTPAGHHATVLGAVMTPGEVPVGPGARIADLVASAGGPRIEVTLDGAHVDLSDFERAQVFRDGRALPIDLVRALEGHPRHNVLAHPGDSIHVPAYDMPNVTVVGNVQQSGSFRHRRGLRVSEAVALAHGPDEHADSGDIRIVRGGPHSPRVYTASLNDLENGEADDPVLAPGDVVVVHESGATKLERFMTTISPILATATAIVLTVILIETR